MFPGVFGSWGAEATQAWTPAQFLFFRPPRAAEGYPQLKSLIKNPPMWLRSEPAEGGPRAPSGSEPQMVWCPLTWKPLGRWCPSGWLGRWEAQAWKDALTTRPFSGCGGRKLFTMWILSSSSEVKSKLRNFSILRQKGWSGQGWVLFSSLVPDAAQGALPFCFSCVASLSLPSVVCFHWAPEHGTRRLGPVLSS